MEKTVLDSKECRSEKGTRKRMRRWEDGRYRMTIEDEGWRKMEAE
jgi:hypothetical protein